MAMQKQEDWNRGGTQPTANYHRICDVRGDPKGTDFKVCVGSWYDKAARDAGDKEYQKRIYALSLATHTDLADVLNNNSGGTATDLLAEAYAAVKAETAQHDAFFNSGVTDVDPD